MNKLSYKNTIKKGGNDQHWGNLYVIILFGSVREYLIFGQPLTILVSMPEMSSSTATEVQYIQGRIMCRLISIERVNWIVLSWPKKFTLIESGLPESIFWNIIWKRAIHRTANGFGCLKIVLPDLIFPCFAINTNSCSRFAHINLALKNLHDVF